jgi:hypothetical protein
MPLSFQDGDISWDYMYHFRKKCGEEKEDAALITFYMEHISHGRNG